MIENNILFEYKARYFQVGQLNSSTRHIIFALHGYGQQAKYFINKFKHLEHSNVCIIAPEGLNRFYLEGFSGRVGATWMTKEDRETDISNYLNFLNNLYTQINESINSQTKISILGFSQGAATVSRWVADRLVKFDHLILWAGIFPPDMDEIKSSQILKGKRVTYVYGTEDKFITKERLIQMKLISSKLNVTPTIITFKGEHKLNEKILTELFVNNRG